MGTHEITQRPDAIDVSGTFETEAEIDDFVRRLYCASEGVWPSPAPAADEPPALEAPSSTAAESIDSISQQRMIDSLSGRQKRVLELLKEGRTRTQIVDQLCITAKTFDNDKYALKQKGLL